MKIAPTPLTAQPNLTQYETWPKIVAYLFIGDFLTSYFKYFLFRY